MCWWLRRKKMLEKKWSEVRSSRGKTRKNVKQCVFVRDSGRHGNRGGNPHSCCPANVTVESCEGNVDGV